MRAADAVARAARAAAGSDAPGDAKPWRLSVPVVALLAFDVAAPLPALGVATDSGVSFRYVVARALTLSECVAAVSAGSRFSSWKT